MPGPGHPQVAIGLTYQALVTGRFDSAGAYLGEIAPIGPEMRMLTRPTRVLANGRDSSETYLRVAPCSVWTSYL
jgi:hypothetical protein